MSIVVVSVLLVAVVALLVTEAVPADLLALGIIVVLGVTGILTPAESLAGFSHPAPITVGVLFVASQGLVRTGALDFVTQRVMRVSQGRSHVLLGLCLFLAGGLSSFVNNTPVVVVFTSIVMVVCCEYSLSPSKFLLPISFVSILAGTSTLIGTSTNIIVSDLAAQHGLEPIGMFELSILGMPMAMAGAVFLFFFASRLLKAHQEPVCEISDDKSPLYISELLIAPNSPLIGRDAAKAFAAQFPNSELYDVLRGSAVLDLLQEESVILQAKDILLAKASAADLIQGLDRRWVSLPRGDEGTIAKPYDERSRIVELIVVTRIKP